MSSNLMSNRNSTPEAGNASSLRLPTARAIGVANSPLRASADMASMTGKVQSGFNRPSSDFYGGQGSTQATGEVDAQDKLAQQWIADIDQYEDTLEEMAAATLDQDFKDELSAIEQWFRVLSEAERTAALYALLQQTTQVQIRFFIQVLQQMGKSHPMAGMLSPTNFDKDPMSNRLSDAMGKLNVNDSARNSLARAPSNAKRQSGLDPSTINAMFPDAAAAIATEKAKFTQQTGAPPTSNRNSTIDRSSLIAPTISAPDAHDTNQGVAASWNTQQQDNRPKSSAGQTPMGQFQQPPPSAGLRPSVQGDQSIKKTTLTAGKPMADLPMFSPYGGPSGSWASMVNTPMVANFGQQQQQQGANQANMVANATAMKLAALSTVNNRFALDDVRKYRRSRSNEGGALPGQNPLVGGAQALGMPGTTVVMVNERGQVVSPEQMMAMQNQGLSRSRPSSPGGMGGAGGFNMGNFASPQNNGFLNPYDGASPLLNNGLGALNFGQMGQGPHDGYLSDHSDMNRGRSPRGRRGSSKAPDDPTDPSLLQDIPAWLRSLRLHKYTDNLKDMRWEDLIELDDKQLEDRGVNALGARRKMLKVFEQVKGKVRVESAFKAMGG